MISNNDKLASTIQTRLLELGLSAEALASAMNMRSLALVSGWLEGTFRPRLETLPALAHALQLDPVELSLAWVASSQPVFAEAIADSRLVVDSSSNRPCGAGDQPPTPYSHRSSAP